MLKKGENVAEQKEITIYDIAQEAGVSPATVSRVLTKSARVSTEKEASVKRVIRKYNFRPNAMARGLSDTFTRTIGILAADIRNPFYAALVVACEKAANKWGYTVVLCNALGDPVLEEKNLEKLNEQRVDAIIQMGCRTDTIISDPHYVEKVRLASRTTPFITTGNLEGVDCHTVNIDDKEGMRIVIDYLYSLGHREMAFLGGRKRDISTYNKWQQYVYSMGKYGLVLREEYTQEGDYEAEGGYVGMKAIFEKGRIPTAVISINDYTALGVMRAVAEQGLLIPADLSLISFDNTFLTEIVSPKLTSVDYDYGKYGEMLISTAIQAIEKKEGNSHRLITPQLVIRDSCRAPHGEKRVVMVN